jgi:demethylmenaquinone methyltransferase/2-methoxy-6-polyprenyl-1,4-benzoquinol methylase
MQKEASSTGDTLHSAGPPVGSPFDRIAPTYDFLNHLLSLGCDRAWRRRAVRRLTERSLCRVADLATGTGDLPIALLRECPDIKGVIALDVSEKMLSIACEKTQRCRLADRVRFLRDDATRTSLPAGSFDAVTMAFGIRNTTDAAETLDEIHRLLKPGGTAVILEFSLPGNRVVRACYLAYLRSVVPLVGGLVSGNKQAYQYLDRSIETFHGPDVFCAMMERAGFSAIKAIPLTWGVASIYTGLKR